MASQKEQNVRVVVRVRPPLHKLPSAASNQRVEKDGIEEVVSCESEKNQVGRRVRVKSTCQGKVWQDFECDAALNDNCSQDDAFRKTGTQELVDHAVTGYRCLLFAYGRTGAGKTHTMIGPPGSRSGRQAGLLGRAVEHLYQTYDAETFKVKLSCFEICGSSINDLLSGPQSFMREPALQLREYRDQGFYVKGLTTVDCLDKYTLQEQADKALRSRRWGSHKLNAHSNRSHLVLSLQVEPVQKPGLSQHMPSTYGSLTFVDLAGSERIKATGSSGHMLLEAKQINMSLYCLGKVMRSIQGGQSSCPYREDKLTKILYSALGGTCKTLMKERRSWILRNFLRNLPQIACISPELSAVQETIRTLRFAVGVKGIVNRPTVVLDPQDRTIRRLEEEIQELRLENAHLRASLTNSPCFAFPLDTSQNQDKQDASDPVMPQGGPLTEPSLLQKDINSTQLSSETHRLKPKWFIDSNKGLDFPGAGRLARMRIPGILGHTRRHRHVPERGSRLVFKNRRLKEGCKMAWEKWQGPSLAALSVEKSDKAQRKEKKEPLCEREDDLERQLKLRLEEALHAVDEQGGMEDNQSNCNAGKCVAEGDCAESGKSEGYAGIYEEDFEPQGHADGDGEWQAAKDKPTEGTPDWFWNPVDRTLPAKDHTAADSCSSKEQMIASPPKAAERPHSGSAIVQSVTRRNQTSPLYPDSVPPYREVYRQTDLRRGLVRQRRENYRHLHRRSDSEGALSERQVMTVEREIQQISRNAWSMSPKLVEVGSSGFGDGERAGIKQLVSLWQRQAQYGQRMSGHGDFVF